MTGGGTPLGAEAIARAVGARRLTAREVIEAALARVAALNPAVNAFTDVVAERALRTAGGIDDKIARGEAPGPLAGVPFGVKNLFDIAGVPTRAGSKINRSHPPASHDATLVTRLEAAGAVLVGGLNMGEYAYDFTGENPHDGPARNPHDLTHMSGGSSSGSGAAVAAAMVPLALGSDTNGSIRVPSALCGLFGLKPTFGRLSRGHTFPFVSNLDHLGPMGCSPRDLALAYDAMQGPDPLDPVLSSRPAEPTLPGLEASIAGLRIARLGGYFAEGLSPEGTAAVDRVAAALGTSRTVELPEAAHARAAAYLITTSEAAALHLTRLREQPGDFDPVVRDRLLSGAMIPGSWVTQAQKFRRWFRDRVRELVNDVDVLIAPATPGTAPKIGQQTMVLNGLEVPLRPNLGLFTQPISFIGLPVCAVPVWLDGVPLPLGVQIIGPAWREDLVLRVARALEMRGAVEFRVANLTGSGA